VRVDLDARRIDFALVGGVSVGRVRKASIRSNLKAGKIKGRSARKDRSRKAGKNRR
jgi:hypothetical protein